MRKHGGGAARERRYLLPSKKRSLRSRPSTALRAVPPPPKSGGGFGVSGNAAAPCGIQVMLKGERIEMTGAPRPDYEALDDAVLAGLVAIRDPAAVRLVTTRNNQRLYRAAFAILGNRAEAEDAVQSAYLRAFAAIRSFEGRSSLSTWLTRIAINEALGRMRATKRRRAHLEDASVAVLDDYREKLMQGSMSGTSPDREQARAQLRRIMEEAIARLPEPFRLVFVLREIEGMDVETVSQTLGRPAGDGEDPPSARAAAAAADACAGGEGRADRLLPLRRRGLRGDDRARGAGVLPLAFRLPAAG